ncbi:D-lactate dehydrogenase [Phellopilus nigrolimitatus]|nr:D-lactate dehydrogenase [Phellopilus nigrolimitatus]
MKIAFFSTKEYDVTTFTPEKALPHTITFIPHRLDAGTAVLAAGHTACCIFVNDAGDAPTLQALHDAGVRTIALRVLRGFHNVDLEKAAELGIAVVRVPAYSPEAIAEFTVGMILTVVRKYHKAYNRVREGNFLLSGLVGFNLSGKTVGIIGTGKIGMLTGKIIARGFGCTVLAHDPFPDHAGAAAAGIAYAPLAELLARADVISLHCPLGPGTRYLLGADTLACTKRGVVLVNTSRGALVDTAALVRLLKSGHVGAVALDVYEREEEYFFRDGSGSIMHDDVLSRLLSFHNVFVTGHQAYLTEEALTAIADMTIQNLSDLEEGKECQNIVRA